MLSAENVIEHISGTSRYRQELEQIGHEEEGLRVLQALEAAGWMKVLFPAWTAARADAEKLTALHDLAVELQVQGVRPDISAAQRRVSAHSKAGAQRPFRAQEAYASPGIR